jgi:hypothetical protein
MRRIRLPKGPVVPNSVGTLKVTILHATNLLSADSNGKSDPYVVVKAGGMAQRTKHVLETLDPVWNKTMEFQGKLETFLARPLHLKLFDMDVFSADDPLGEVKVSLDYLILGGQQDFVERVQPVNGTLDPSQGTLKVTIKHANGLMAADSNGLSDPYVAVHAGGIAKKSKVIPKTLDPVWNVTWELQGKLEVFLAEPMHIEIFDKDPFVSLDQEGVGDLIRIATERGRAVRPDVKLGICGEHGGDPASIDFCERVGLDYVSCSPYRVPVARLAAAQATIVEMAEKAGASTAQRDK